MKCKPPLRIVLSFLMILTMLAPLQAAEPSAKQILDASGITGGLIVHLACNDGQLTAALRAGDAYLVHGLDTDRANVEKARRHIASLGLCGDASVD